MRFSPPLVRAARAKAGISQRAVAERARTSLDTVRRAELGLHVPGADVLGRIASALGVTVDDFYVDAAVRTRREGKGWSMERLAHEAGRSTATIYRAEKGRHRTSEDVLEDIAEALGCDVSDLHTSDSDAPGEQAAGTDPNANDPTTGADEVAISSVAPAAGPQPGG